MRDLFLQTTVFPSVVINLRVTNTFVGQFQTGKALGNTWRDDCTDFRQEGSKRLQQTISGKKGKGHEDEQFEEQQTTVTQLAGRLGHDEHLLKSKQHITFGKKSAK